MASQQELLKLHDKAITMLKHKLSRITERVFENNRKPTISDIYSENAEAVYMKNIPHELQLDYVFANYHEFVNLNFRARKIEAKMNVSLAIWYWQMDQSHSFSQRHKQVRYNILMACIIGASSKPFNYVTEAGYDFCFALINAWIWSVTHQDESTVQAQFLHLWTSGPYDLMRFSRYQLVRMEKAIKRLEQYVPKCKPNPHREFCEGVGYTPRSVLSRFGAAWAIQWIVDKEIAAKEIEVMGQKEGVEIELATGSFRTLLNSMGFSQAPSGLTPDLFEKPLVRALLTEPPEDVEMVCDEAEELQSQAWMDPDVAIDMIDGTRNKYESITPDIAIATTFRAAVLSLVLNGLSTVSFTPLNLTAKLSIDYPGSNYSSFKLVSLYVAISTALAGPVGVQLPATLVFKCVKAAAPETSFTYEYDFVPQAERKQSKVTFPAGFTGCKDVEVTIKDGLLNVKLLGSSLTLATVIDTVTAVVVKK